MSGIEFHIEGQDRLVRQLRALGGPTLRKLAKKVTFAALAPVLSIAQRTVPVQSGRLRASLGELVHRHKRGDAISARVGTRRDFTYVSTRGDFKVSGRGKVRDRAIGKGFRQDKTTAQQYARGIEFGVSKDGRIRRKAGAANFLENAIVSQQSSIITNVADGLRRYVENP